MSISIVIASKVGPPFLYNCLHSLASQAGQMQAEVIVVSCGNEPWVEAVACEFPWVRLLKRPAPATVPSLRREGVLAATRDFVAIIEEHCIAGERWLEEAWKALAGGHYGAVGGPVLDNNYRRLRDWVVYFCEYNGYLPPAPDAETWDLNGANIAYRRELLLKHERSLEGGYWEATLHPILLAEGVKFRSLPQMIVRHCGPFGFLYYLRQRYWFSRAFAGARAARLPLARRALYLAAAPVVPALLWARMAARVWRKRCRRGWFAASLPLIAVALTAYVAGEWVGFLAGPGDALLKVE